MIDYFLNSKLSKKYYSGSERKIGIIFNNEKYMLKFRKKNNFVTKFNHVSEYLGSHIFNLIGIKVQETFLGLYNGEEVVACKDFITDEGKFVPFNEIGESSLETDKEKYQYSYDDILELINKNTKIKDKRKTIENFFDIFIVDALIGNFDRHGMNWGFIKSYNKYELSPVFDNGSCLFPSMVDDEEMIRIMNDKGETNNRVYNFPTSQIKLHDRKSSYFDVINSLEFEECNNALLRIFPRINMDAIYVLIDETPFITDVHKMFYKHILKNRYEKIIKASYLKLVKRNETD